MPESKITCATLAGSIPVCATEWQTQPLNTLEPWKNSQGLSRGLAPLFFITCSLAYRYRDDSASAKTLLLQRCLTQCIYSYAINIYTSMLLLHLLKQTSSRPPQTNLVPTNSLTSFTTYQHVRPKEKLHQATPVSGQKANGNQRSPPPRTCSRIGTTASSLDPSPHSSCSPGHSKIRRPSEG